MSELVTLRDRIVQRIKTALPGFGVEPHLGRFTADDLKRFGAKAPAVRVAVLALERPANGNPGGAYLARIGIFVVTTDRAATNLDKATSSLAAVDTILALTEGQRWGLPFCLAAEGTTAANLHADALSALGVAIWALDLRQPVRLHVEHDAPDALKELWIGFAPRIGPAHREDYLGPFEAPAGGVDLDV